MSNPFDNADGTFLVLAKDEGQYSLRPSCLDFIEAQWTDMRPKSLIAAMESD
ncbi:MbtH family protein [Streptomyces mirabilis]|uniref:MbtH family protein n=1 Tax=Streptomyces mirabilis TaxID=68239 RepID=UPI0036E793B0